MKGQNRGGVSTGAQWMAGDAVEQERLEKQPDQNKQTACVFREQNLH